MSEKNQDLGITQKQDGEYWDIVIPGLDANTDYAAQFAWVYADKQKGVSDFSDFFEFKTPAPRRTCPINVVASWDGKANLNISFEKPFLADNITRDNRIKLFQVTIFAAGEEPIFASIASKESVNEYRWQLSQQDNMANFGNEFKTVLTGKITSIYGDGSSDDCSFNIPEYVDPICQTTPVSPTVIGIDNGILVSWNDAATNFGTYRESRVYVSTTNNPYNWVLRDTGFGPSSITLDTLNTVYVKLNHLSDSGCQSIDSPIVEGNAYDTVPFDDQPPQNDFSLGTATVTDDANGLFSFDKKVLFTWTQNSDDDTAGYRIRFRISGSTGPYTFMSVPGKSKTSTYLYGLKGGQTYEIGVSTYDVYGNTNESQWRTYPNIVAPVSTSLLPDVAITAGDMKLGYGIGGDNSQKGLYIAPDNYWYVQGNTNVSSAAYFIVGGSNDKMIWNGSNLSVTGTVNANAGEFTGSVDIGTNTVDGQLRIRAGGTAKVEIGKYQSSISAPGTTPTTLGIQVTGSDGKYVQLDTINGIIAVKGTIAGWTINQNSIHNANNIGFYSTTDNNDIAIWAGGSRLGTPGPNFSVTYGGALTATEATIKGSIEARAGYFGLYDSVTKTITQGWKINGKFLESYSTAFANPKIKLDGLQGTIAGGNIVGSNFYFMDPDNWYVSNPGSGSGNPGNIDYISSSGNFRLANGRLTYDGDSFKVQTDLVASNVFLGSVESFSSDYLLGKNSTIGNITKNAGSFSLGGGAIIYDASTDVLQINESGKPYDKFKIKLNVTSDENGTFGDSTVVQNSSGYLTTGRAFYYGGNNYPDGATQRSTAQDPLGRAFVVGDIWLSRKA